jgi:hypothetical protein
MSEKTCSTETALPVLENFEVRLVKIDAADLSDRPTITSTRTRSDAAQRPEVVRLTPAGRVWLTLRQTVLAG